MTSQPTRDTITTGAGSLEGGGPTGGFQPPPSGALRRARRALVAAVMTAAATVLMTGSGGATTLPAPGAGAALPIASLPGAASTPAGYGDSLSAIASPGPGGSLLLVSCQPAPTRPSWSVPVTNSGGTASAGPIPIPDWAAIGWPLALVSVDAGGVVGDTGCFAAPPASFTGSVGTSDGVRSMASVLIGLQNSSSPVMTPSSEVAVPILPGAATTPHPAPSYAAWMAGLTSATATATMPPVPTGGTGGYVAPISQRHGNGGLPPTRPSNWVPRFMIFAFWSGLFVLLSRWHRSRHLRAAAMGDDRPRSRFFSPIPIAAEIGIVLCGAAVVVMPTAAGVIVGALLAVVLGRNLASVAAARSGYRIQTADMLTVRPMVAAPIAVACGLLAYFVGLAFVWGTGSIGLAVYAIATGGTVAAGVHALHVARDRQATGIWTGRQVAAVLGIPESAMGEIRWSMSSTQIRVDPPIPPAVLGKLDGLSERLEVIMPEWMVASADRNGIVFVPADEAEESRRATVSQSGGLVTSAGGERGIAPSPTAAPPAPFVPSESPIEIKEW